MKQNKETYELPTALCWVCEKLVKGGVFTPFIVTNTGDATTCLKCATHKYEVDNTGIIHKKPLNNK